MKKMIAILLALVMVCSLFGCTKQNTDAPVAGTDSTAEKKLSFGFVSKTTADPMFIGTYKGFEEACNELGIECI